MQNGDQIVGRRREGPDSVDCGGGFGDFAIGGTDPEKVAMFIVDIVGLPLDYREIAVQRCVPSDGDLQVAMDVHRVDERFKFVSAQGPSFPLSGSERGSLRIASRNCCSNAACSG